MVCAAARVSALSGSVQVDFSRNAQRFDQIGLLALTQRADSAVEHFAIEAEADFLHGAGLILAEDFAGAANFQVVHGEDYEIGRASCRERV